MSTTYTFRVDLAEGTMLCLDNEVVDLPSFGTRRITRASRVEFSDEKQGWLCSHPEGGLIAGQPENGFSRRSEALAWERNWANSQIETR